MTRFSERHFQRDVQETAGESAHTVKMVGSWLLTRDVNTGIVGDVLSSVKLARISGLDV